MNIRTIFTSLIALYGLSLAGCTSEKGQLEDLGQALAEKKWEETLTKEARDLNNSAFLQDAYIRYFRSNSEVEVDEVKMHSPLLATVSTHVTAPSQGLRRTVLDVAARMNPAKARQFNFANATALIAQEKGVANEKTKQGIEAFKFSKIQDRWSVME